MTLMPLDKGRHQSEDTNLLFGMALGIRRFALPDGV